MPAATLQGAPLNQENLRRDDLPDPEVYAQDAFFPGKFYDACQPFVMRGRRLLKLTFYPLQYHPLKGCIHFYDEIIIRISFPNAQEKNGAAIPSKDLLSHICDASILNYNQAAQFEKNRRTAMTAPAPHPCSISDAAKLLIEEDGVYVVTRLDLTAAGMDLTPVDPRNLKLFNRGGEIAIHFVGQSDGTFDTLDFFEFYGEAVDDDFTLSNVYWLIEDDSTGTRITQRDGSGSGTVPDAYWDTRHFEENNLYFQNIPNGEDLDHWFWDMHISGDKSHNYYYFDLPNRYPTSDDSHLKVRLQPKTDLPLADEHHVKLHINGHFIGEEIWEDMVPEVMECNFSQSLLSEMNNELDVELVENQILNMI